MLLIQMLEELIRDVQTPTVEVSVRTVQQVIQLLKRGQQIEAETHWLIARRPEKRS